MSEEILIRQGAPTLAGIKRAVCSPAPAMTGRRCWTTCGG